MLLIDLDTGTCNVKLLLFVEDDEVLYYSALVDTLVNFPSFTQLTLSVC